MGVEVEILYTKYTCISHSSGIFLAACVLDGLVITDLLILDYAQPYSSVYATTFDAFHFLGILDLNTCLVMDVG